MKKYGAIADEMFDGWGIPGRYLVFGEKKDLAALKERELTKLSHILAEHDAANMSKALEQASLEPALHHPRQQLPPAGGQYL